MRYIASKKVDGITSPEGTDEGMVVVKVSFPSVMKAKGLKVAPHSAIFKKRAFQCKSFELTSLDEP